MKKTSTRNSASGILHEYKNPGYIDKERDAFINALLERHNMAKEITIELTRENFCMADDATAPNAETTGELPETYKALILKEGK